MSIKMFKKFETGYNQTKPIRGRSTDIRPVGDRRRDWEQIVHREDKTGLHLYGAKLYNTDCILFASNGDIHLNLDSWVSISTSQFINRFLPYGITCFKRYSKMWVELSGRVYPMQTNQTFVLKYDEGKDFYSTDVSTTVTQRVIDKEKSKEVRSTVSEFRQYVKNIMKLSDGWIREELEAKYVTYQNEYYRSKHFMIGGEKFGQSHLRGGTSTSVVEKVYEYIRNKPETDTETHDEKMYRFQNAMCAIACGVQNEERNLVRTETYQFKDYKDQDQERQEEIYEYRYKYQSILRRVDYFVTKANENELMTTKEVYITDKPKGNLV